MKRNKKAKNIILIVREFGEYNLIQNKFTSNQLNFKNNLQRKFWICSVTKL